MVSVPRTGALCAPHRHKNPLLSYGVCLFTEFDNVTAWGARRLKFIFGVPYNACYVHRASRKSINASALGHPENWPRISGTVFPPYVWNREQTKGQKNANLPPKEKISGIHRNSNAKASEFSPMYSCDFGLHVTHTCRHSFCQKKATGPTRYSIHDVSKYSHVTRHGTLHTKCALP